MAAEAASGVVGSSAGEEEEEEHGCRRIEREEPRERRGSRLCACVLERGLGENGFSTLGLEINSSWAQVTSDGFTKLVYEIGFHIGLRQISFN